LVNLKALLNKLSSICRSRMGSTVRLPRFSCASTSRRFLFCSASCPAVSMTSLISGASCTVCGLSSTEERFPRCRGNRRGGAAPDDEVRRDQDRRAARLAGAAPREGAVGQSAYRHHQSDPRLLVGAGHCDFAISRPIALIVCIFGSSESWGRQQHPHPWHFRAGGGAVHSINSRLSSVIVRLSCRRVFRVLGQIIGDLEPRRLAADEDVACWSHRWIIENGERDAVLS